jgi:hypothetical protein
LNRAIDFKSVQDRADFDRLVAFCVSVFDELGVTGSILFRTIDLGRLTAWNLMQIGDRRQFVLPFVSTSSFVTVLDSLSYRNEAELRFNECGNRLEYIEAEMKAFARKTEFEALARETDSITSIIVRQRELESSIEHLKSVCAIKAEAATVRSDYVMKSAFQSFQSELSMNCRRSDLKEMQLALSSLNDRVATKAELVELKSEMDNSAISQRTSVQSMFESLQSNVVLKSDFQALNSSVATKTELNALGSTLATKTELNSVSSSAATKAELSSLRAITSTQMELGQLKSDLTGLQNTAVTKAELTVFPSVFIPWIWAPFFTQSNANAIWEACRPLVFQFGLDKPRLAIWGGPIILCLTVRCGGNVHDRQAVNITSSSLLGASWAKTWHYRNAADWGTDSHFSTSSSSQSWLCSDFKKQRVWVTHYFLRSGRAFFPRSWVLEGSNSADSLSWTLLDSQSDTTELNGQGKIATFAVSATTPFCCIRLRHTGNNHGGCTLLALAGLELFGTVYE